jgi:CHAD domain-containing protein
MSVYRKEIHNLFSRVDRQLTKAAAKARPQDVHRLRTSIRRLEAVLEESSPQLDQGQRKLLKLLTRLRRRAGRVRDMDVQIAALRSLKVSEQPNRKSQILASLADQRASFEKKLLRAMDGITVKKVRRRLGQVESGLQLPKEFSDPLAFASANFARLAEQNPVLSETSLHQYRINGKRVRYIAELAGRTAEAQSFIGHLKHMQDVLGEWHDWLSLTESVERITDSARPSSLSSALNNITRAKFREAIEAVNATKAALLPPQTARGSRQASAVSPPALRRKTSPAPALATAAVA